MACQSNGGAFSFLTMSFDMVTVRFGEPDSAVDIPIYRELLASVSPYFRGAFNGEFKEVSDGIISLTDVTEQIFRIFLQWAHSRLQPPSSCVRIPDVSILPTEKLFAAAKCTTGKAKAKVDLDNEDTGDEDNDGEHSSTSSADEPTLDSDEVSSVDESALDSDEVSSADESAPDFDEVDYQSGNYSCAERDFCKRDRAWNKAYDLSLISYLNLYIFADKYSVHQLRDDIVTAMIGQANTWGWVLRPEQQWLDKAYSRLPHSAKLIKLLAVSTAFYWLPGYDENIATRLQALRTWQPDFGYEVGLMQARFFEAVIGANNFRVEDYPEANICSSCKFHEHLVLDEKACRERIKVGAHVFVELIRACAKDGVSMLEE